MEKIILASGSIQRKKLLDRYQIPFKVIPSDIKEIKHIKTTCASLVKENSLLKAQDVAQNLNAGIVIGSDTVVYIGHKQIIGKPKSIKQARDILRTLFTRPQWVYTGVALINAKTGQRLVDYEKTKIYMNHLTEEEIDLYHKKVSPFDKAGGFDIEGWGGLFIHRIEGCYSNVIGLPMAKLFTMLKKMGVSLLGAFLCINLIGCSTEYNLATKKQETLMYSTEKEVQIGDSVAAQVKDNYKFIEDIDANERVKKILDKIVEVCDRKDVTYFIKIIDEEDLNAVSLPGGYVYIFKGLLDKVKNDDQLAGVIAHEVGHITARHSVKRLQAYYGAMLLQLASIETGGRVASGVNFALTSLFMEYSQEAEFESDRLAVKYLKKAGYDPNQMTDLLEILYKENQKEPLRKYSYWRTHPHIKQRMAIVNKELSGKLEFKDYLNLVGEK